MGQILGCVQVSESELGIEERFGKYKGTLDAGCHCLPWCCGSYMAGKLSNQVKQLEFHCETKSKDDVFLTLAISVEYLELETDSLESQATPTVAAQAQATLVQNVGNTQIALLDAIKNAAVSAQIRQNNPEDKEAAQNAVAAAQAAENAYIAAVDAETALARAGNAQGIQNVAAQNDNAAARPMKVRAFDAFYGVSNIRKHIEMHVLKAVSSQVHQTTLDEIFTGKDKMEVQIRNSLIKATMKKCVIVNIAITGIELDVHVKRAMNEQIAATRLRNGAEHKGEAEKIIKMKRAEALDAKIIAFTKSIPNDQANAKNVVDMALVSDYIDALKEMGASKSFSLTNLQRLGTARAVADQIKNGLGLGEASSQ
ncbi:hypothetical protein Scep_017957 [Stephania cephalantha]|uniref:Band 7 domain-containing protein n=1 Tax=Stephania cephalantha TaxID=152367 RepID=A0AAP0IQE6_9MAGN